jgi:hypothetical protein
MPGVTLQRARLLALIVGSAAAIALSASVVANDSSLLRVGIAVLIIGAMLLMSLRNPQVVALLTICSLPLLAFGRRILIPWAGWTPWDALLVVAPVVSVILAYRLFVMKRRPVSRDVLSSIIGLFLLFEVLESVNPATHGLIAGLTGLLFAAAPLGWFFIGRELADRRMVTALLTSTVLLGVGIALYGLWQTNVGLPSWDAAWQALTGYTALSVRGSIRAFGTFSSSGEYATFLGIALVVAFAAVLHSRLIAMVALPVLAYALFLESSRGVVVLVLLACAIVVGMRTGRAIAAGLSISVAVIASAATIIFFGPQLTDTAAQTGNPFIAHQVGGLLNPFDPKQSTLGIHQRQVVSGITGSFEHPLGLGLAAINPQVGRLSDAASASTEADVSNAFAALGPGGGILYSFIVLLTFWQASRLAFADKRLASLAAVALLVTCFGQWLNGGYYAVAPLVWFVVGWINQEWLEHRASQRAAVAAKKPRHPAVAAWSVAARS